MRLRTISRAQAEHNMVAWRELPPDVRPVLTELAQESPFRLGPVEVSVGYRFGLARRQSPAVVVFRRDPGADAVRLRRLGFYERVEGGVRYFVYDAARRDALARLASLPLDVMPWAQRAAEAGLVVRCCIPGEGAAPCMMPERRCPGRPHVGVRYSVDVTRDDLRDELVAAGFVQRGIWLLWPEPVKGRSPKGQAKPQPPATPACPDCGVAGAVTTRHLETLEPTPGHLSCAACGWAWPCDDAAVWASVEREDVQYERQEQRQRRARRG